jgi:anti-sigma factor RsiW
MSCPQWEEKIAQLVGGDFAAADAAAVESHVKTCASCADLAKALAADRDLLAAPPQAVFHVDFVSMRREIRSGIIRERRRRILATMLMAAAALLAVAGIAALQRLDSTVPEPPLVADPAIPAASLVASKAVKPRTVPRRPSDAELSAALAAVEAPKPEPLTESPGTLRVPTRDPKVVILWIPEGKGDNQ